MRNIFVSSLALLATGGVEALHNLPRRTNHPVPNGSNGYQAYQPVNNPYANGSQQQPRESTTTNRPQTSTRKVNIITSAGEQNERALAGRAEKNAELQRELDSLKRSGG